MHSIYRIRNLKCQYPRTEYPVLYIKTLDILRGDIVFFVGASGVGKSTLLETLGLMTHTVFPSEETAFLFQANEGETIDLSDAWNMGGRALARFRKKHLSFIFQDMNLFSHLSMYQNAYLPGILQGDGFEASKRNGGRLFQNILPELTGENQGDREITEMSGGQRQRLAFIRALSNPHSVLFADEPTGNLDPVNARKLMTELSEQSTELTTKIIVSHDIELALSFADQIVLINKANHIDISKTYGVIDETSIFKNLGNDLWETHEGTFVTARIKNQLMKTLEKQAT